MDKLQPYEDVGYKELSFFLIEVSFIAQMIA